jgi:hypothetical protein
MFEAAACAASRLVYNLSIIAVYVAEVAPAKVPDRDSITGWDHRVT